MPEPFDSKTVKKIAEELRRQPGFAKRDETLRERRQVRYRQKAVNHPRIRKDLEVLSPLINQHIGLYSRRLDAARINISLVAKSAKDEDRDVANRIKQYFMRSYIQTNRSQLVPPSVKVLDRQSGDGVGWYRQRLDPSLLERLNIDSGRLEGSLKIGGVPFVLETPDPAAVYYTPDMAMIAEVGVLTETNQVVGGDTMPQLAGGTVWRKLQRIIRLETNHFVYDLRGEGESEVFSFAPNIFRKPAYVPVPGLITGSSEPAEAFQPLIVNMYPHVEQKNLYRTMLNNAADLTGAPLFYLRKGGDAKNPADWMILPSDTRREMTIDTGTGKVDVPEGYEPTPLSLAAGIDLIRAMEDLRIEMRDTGFPMVLALPHEVQARSGYDRRVMERAIGFYIEPPLANHARAWYELFRRQAEAIKELGISVVVRTVRQKGECCLFEPVVSAQERQEVEVGPEDFVDIDMEIGFSSMTTAGRIALQEEGMRLLERELLSETEFFEDYRGSEDVERARRLRDRDLRRRAAREAALAFFQAILAERYGEELSARVGGRRRQPRRRPPRGEATPGVGATLAQPQPPHDTEEPALGDMEGVV